MPRETELFFEEILRADRSLTEFVHSDWTFLNQRLAQHYGIAGVSGGELRKVKLPPGSHRGGVLTQAQHPEGHGRRHADVAGAARQVGAGADPRPAAVARRRPTSRPSSPTSAARRRSASSSTSTATRRPAPRATGTSTRPASRWRPSTSSAAGATSTGPPGPTGAGLVDLANYPGRQIFRGPDVEKGGKTPDGQAFQDIDDYKQILLADKDQLARNLAQKLLDLRHRGGHPVRRPRGGRRTGGEVPRQELRLPLAGP